MKEEDRKKFEKKKDFRNVGENKKDSYVKPISKFAIKKSSKMEELFTPEVFMKDEVYIQETRVIIVKSSFIAEKSIMSICWGRRCQKHLAKVWKGSPSIP